MNISTPCSATNTSINANGEITGIFAVEYVTDEIISIDIQIDVAANNSDTFLVLSKNKQKRRRKNSNILLIIMGHTSIESANIENSVQVNYFQWNAVTKYEFTHICQSCSYRSKTVIFFRCKSGDSGHLLGGYGINVLNT